MNRHVLLRLTAIGLIACNWPARGNAQATSSAKLRELPAPPSPETTRKTVPGWVQTELGGSAAPLDLSEGGKTNVQLATLPDDGPTGGYFHLGEALRW
jgi:hypothetical protein